MGRHKTGELYPRKISMLIVSRYGISLGASELGSVGFKHCLPVAIKARGQPRYLLSYFRQCTGHVGLILSLVRHGPPVLTVMPLLGAESLSSFVCLAVRALLRQHISRR
jgi:hypothetical protein